MADFLEDQTIIDELPGWIEYCRLEDELQTVRMARAITMAFRPGDTKPSQSSVVDDDDGEIIDTTKPEFAEKFKGFINIPPTPKPTQRFRNTEVMLG